MDNDDLTLHRIQERLARAWVEHDRGFIDGVLAPEWQVTQADGSILSKADVMALAFDDGGLTVTRCVVDDISVARFGDVAIVRGRTDAAGTVNGVSSEARIRFTDTFIKRDGRWRAVASHASAIAS